MFGPLTITLFNVIFAPFKFRNGGVNYIVTRRTYISPPWGPILEVVGSVNGVRGDELALAVLENIKGKFIARGLRWSYICS